MKRDRALIRAVTGVARGGSGMLLLSFLAGWLGAAANGIGQPANDNFANRLPLPLFQATALNTRLATREGGERLLQPRASGRTVWWTWTAPATGRLEIYTSGLVGLFKGEVLDQLTRIKSSRGQLMT